VYCRGVGVGRGQGGGEEKGNEEKAKQQRTEKCTRTVGGEYP